MEENQNERRFENEKSKILSGPTFHNRPYDCNDWLLKQQTTT
jgi:hypothetical protein